jgi:pimeloyl-ACP methyl ester carboxylesterase
VAAVVVLAAACLVGALVAPGAVASASPGRGGAVVPVSRWHSCPPGSPAALVGGFVCATAVVPPDYRHPRGAQIRLALVKHPATGPGRRLGTLFVNPGGPGELGSVDIPAYFGLVPAAETAFLGPAAFFPVGRARQRAYIRTWARFDALCGLRNGALLDHVTTADTARDLNLLRQAVGDPMLNYLGESYGAYLGATYANLFPGTIRAMVLDGNVAPTLWTNNNDPHATLTVQQRMDTDVATAATLDAFLALCGQATTKDCAFSAGTPAKTRAKFTVLLARLRKGPITITIGGQKATFSYASLLTDLAAGMQITRLIISPIPSATLPG